MKVGAMFGVRGRDGVWHDWELESFDSIGAAHEFVESKIAGLKERLGYDECDSAWMLRQKYGSKLVRFHLNLEGMSQL